MKKLLIAALFITVVLILPASPQRGFARAQTPVYARAAVRDAYFFTERDQSTSIFIVPYTYCVEVVRDDGDWYYARYASDNGVYRALYGYCRKKDFTVVDGTPQVTFLYKTVSVRYTSGESSPSLPVLGEISVEAAFYGTFYSGATAYSYVFAQGSFGYILGANDDYPLNEIEVPPTTPDNTPASQPAQINAALITALVICALAAAVVLMLFLSSKKPARKD